MITTRLNRIESNRELMFGLVVYIVFVACKKSATDGERENQRCWPCDRARHWETASARERRGAHTRVW